MDQMGPVAAKSYPGQQVVNAQPNADQNVERAKQEIDYGRRGKGYVFGALCPTTGATATQTYQGRTIANWIAFLTTVEAWLDPTIAHVYAIVDNLNVHHATDVLLFTLAHPRWEFVFQPKYAAYLNLIEPWWKTLRSLALKGRRFETWDEVRWAVEQATIYWNTHRHPFVWGQRRRHRPHRQPGLALVPQAA